MRWSNRSRRMRSRTAWPTCAIAHWRTSSEIQAPMATPMKANISHFMPDRSPPVM